MEVLGRVAGPTERDATFAARFAVQAQVGLAVLTVDDCCKVTPGRGRVAPGISNWAELLVLQQTAAESLYNIVLSSGISRKRCRSVPLIVLVLLVLVIVVVLAVGLVRMVVLVMAAVVVVVDDGLVGCN